MSQFHLFAQSGSYLTLMVLFLTTTGCQSGPDNTISSGTMVVERPGQVEAGDELWWNTIFERFRKADRDEDLDQMERLLKITESREQPDWVEEKVVFYRTLLRAKKLIKEQQIRAFFTLSKRDFGVNEFIKVRLRIENKLPGETVLPLPGEKAIVRTQMTTMDLDIYGGTNEIRKELTLPLNKPITVPARGVTEAPFSPFSIGLLPGIAMRTVTFKGRLLLAGSHLLAGGEELPLKTLAVGSIQFRVFGKGFRKLQQKPLFFLQKALEKADRKYLKTVFLSGLFLPKKDHPKAIPLLINALRDSTDKKCSRSLMALLRELTGKTLPIVDPEEDPKKWLDWWDEKTG